MKIKNLLTTLALTATFLFVGNVGWGQVSITSLNSPYTQDFNTLAITGTTNTWTDNTTIAGWYSSRTVYIASDGSLTNGALYSFGTTGTTERALGGVCSGSTGTIYYGCRFVNNTGSVIGSLVISFDGEQWRNGGVTATQPLTFSYQIGANAINTGTWISVSQLTFNSLIGTTTAAAIDGNAVANRTAGITYEITGLNIANGQEVWIRWEDINDTGNDHGLAIDNFSFTAKADTQAPIATYSPTNGATDIAINSTPTISFNEAIRNTDDTEITDANVGSLVTLKEKVSGNTAASTITIDATKKLITITPNANLANSMEYEISIAAVEDASNNATTLATSTFTTIGASTPTITLTAPNAGGKFYAGAQATITWTSTNIDAAETINIEVAPNGVDYQPLATSTNDGTETITIPAAAIYATTYKIKVSYSTASDESDVAFTVIPVVSNIAAFKALAPGTVAKISGEVILTFIRTANRNQKYVQDATGGLLIDDPTPAVITTTHNLYDGITGLEGTLVMFGTYTSELVPTVNTAASTSTGNTVTPAVITLAQLKADHIQYQSMLVKVQDVAINQANGTATFAVTTDYTMQKGTETAVLRQAWKADETDIDGAIIPQGALDIVGIVAQYTSGGTTTAQLSPRTLADITDKAPIATINPASGATGIASNVIPTITFSEPIRNTDDSEITNANVGSLVTLKVKSSGNTVASTITIDATKKVITITPSANLANNTEFEISIAAVEDINNNATTAATSTFTTVDAATPTITLTAPNGGEKFYAGAQATITWTSTNIDAAETITIEVAPNGTTYEFLATSTNDGTETVTIPANAAYATTYKIRVSYSTTSDESNAAFTVIATTDNLAALRALPVNSLVKYTGKATVTFPTSYRNQKYIQDATAAILIDDPTTAPGYITDSYAIGDGISNIEGKISVYANLIQLVPQTTTGEKVTGNPTITPEVRTIASLTAADQCKLIKIENMSLSATGNFAARTNYDVVGQVNTAFVLRSAPDGADYIGTAIPVYPFDVVSVVGQFNAVMQVTPRRLADFDVHLPVYTVTFTVTRNSAAIEGASISINSQTLTTNASGVATIDLPNGTYSYNVTKDGYNTNNGSVVVADAVKAVNIVMTLTGVETNSISKLNAYPNPFSNEIRFDGAEIARVTITSIIGQVVMDKVVAGENLVETQNLSKGIYLVKFTNNKGESVLRKLVKE